MTLYQQISANKRNSAILMVVVITLVIGAVAVYSYAVRQDFVLPIIAAVLTLPTALIGYYSGDKIALTSNGARHVTPGQAPELHRLVENLAITAGIPKPKLYVIESSALNAFATGRDPEHASVAVTTGLINHLDRGELEGVIAHELAHVKNFDIRFTTLVSIFIGFVVILSDLVLRATLWGGLGGRDRRDAGQLGAILAIVGIVALVLSPIVGQLIQLAISRQREYLADSSAVLLTRYPEGLASALEKLAHSKPLPHASKATAHLFIANPFSARSALKNMFSTHPPIEERIKRLRQLA